MNNVLEPKTFKKAEILGALIACIMAPLFHFTYEFSGFNAFVGLFSAVNESVWEHSKMLYFPFLLCSVIEYFILKPNFKRFLAAKSVSLAFLPIVMILFFYTYTGVFGAEILAADISATFVLLIFAFIISYKLYQRGPVPKKHFGWFLFLFFLFLAMELLLTLFPFHIPLFQDSITGTFGFPV